MPERFLVAEDADAIVRQVRGAAIAVISETKAAGDAGGLAQRLMARVHAECERLAEEALASGPRVACFAGCRWCCCGTRVDLLAPEALVIAEHLVAAGQDGVRTRIGDALGARQMSAEERHRTQLPCPLLDPESGRCTIHPVRPLACRGQSSMRAADCRRALENWSEDRPIPKNVRLLMTQSAAATGLGMALKNSGLDGRVLELASALDVALSHGQAAVRWAQGEKLFGQAARADARGRLPKASPPTKNQLKAARRARRSR